MKRTRITKKIIVYFLLLFLININGGSLTTCNVLEENNFENNILYVGGGGPGNYTKIQNAIDNASINNTVFVYNGTYYENIKINKSINLLGQEKNTTVINGCQNLDVVLISANQVCISGFKIDNCGKSGRDTGIEIRSNYNKINGNILINNTIGLFLYYSNHNTITNNTILKNKDYGIYLHESHKNNISNNCLTDNRWGIFFYNASDNSILKNTIQKNHHYGIWFSMNCNKNNITGNTLSHNNDYGILLIMQCNNNNISGNNIIMNNGYGIYFYISDNNNIIGNNFLENKYHAGFKNCKNYWEKNYWNKPRIIPKLIFGTKYILPWFNIDLHPLHLPYDISSINFKGNNPTFITEKNSENNICDLPDSFDWRNINGTDYTTPIKNQLPAPTCEAYALCASIETLAHFLVGYNFGCDLSDVHLYFFSGGTFEAGGVNVQEAAEYLIENGVPDEGCFPDPHRPYDYPFESLPDWQNRTIKIKEWGWVENDVESIKQALIDYGPLIIHMIIRNDFLYYTGGIYKPRLTSPILGWHLMTLIGYNDDQECWIIKNSIDKKWGEDGYIRVAYDADTLSHPFFFPGYGGTGILYVNDIYGELISDVPKVKIEHPEIYHTYFFGRKILTPSNIPTTFRVFIRKTLIQEAAPCILGGITIKVNATNNEFVEFFLDDQLQYIDEVKPYEWRLKAGFGLHTLEVFARNKENTSKATLDLFVLV